MKAIITKFYGPTGTRAAKVVASDADGNKASCYLRDYPATSFYGAEREAVHKLCNQMDWHGKLVVGYLGWIKGHNTYAWVWIDDADVTSHLEV